MHRLVIVSGPNRGSAYSLIEGENSIGRQLDNHIVLSSAKVSKRHCAMLVTPQEVFLRDEGSTNGTFVNGTMVRKIPLKPGDRIGVGEFVLELVSATLGKQAPAIIPEAEMPMQPSPVTLDVQQPEPELVLQEPEDLPGKIKFHFEMKLMPSFYGMLMKNQYRAVVAILLFVTVLISVMGALMPIQDVAMKSIESEAALRARIMAKEMADRFTPMLANRAESQIDVTVLDRDPTVRMAAIVDANMQFIAPQSKMGTMLGSGPEALLASIAIKSFKDGSEKAISKVSTSRSVAIHIEPIRVVDPQQLKTRFAGMAIASVDFSKNTMQTDDIQVVYGLAFVIAGLIGAFFYFVLIRLTLKPFEVLNDDLDKVLRGELPKVTHEFKIEELDNLWFNINSAVQRISKGGGSDFGGGDQMVNWDREYSGLKTTADVAGFGFISFDSEMTVVGMNSQFEEISGIRMDAIGQGLQQIARDQSMVSLIKDLHERVQGSQNRTATDDFEFSGVAYQVVGVGAGPEMQSGLGVVFRKKD